MAQRRCARSTSSSLTGCAPLACRRARHHRQPHRPLRGFHSGRQDPPPRLAPRHRARRWQVRRPARRDGRAGLRRAAACARRAAALRAGGLSPSPTRRACATVRSTSAAASLHGVFDPTCSLVTDADGIPLAEAIRAFGGDPDAPGARARGAATSCLAMSRSTSSRVPCSRSAAIPSASSPRFRGRRGVGVTFSGDAGHAGTVPMTLRHDALTAAAEFALAVEALGQQTPDSSPRSDGSRSRPARATSSLAVAELSLDVRHPDDACAWRRSTSCAPRQKRSRSAVASNSTGALAQGRRAWPAHPGSQSLRSRSRGALAILILTLPSGAGHDAAIMSRIAEIAMLFVRCARRHQPLASRVRRRRRRRRRHRRHWTLPVPAGERRTGRRAMTTFDTLLRGGHRRPASRMRRRRWRTLASPTARSPPSGPTSTGAAREEIDCADLHHLPRRDRRPRPLQRAGAHRVGGLRHRLARARRRRRDRLHRDAAQRPSAHPRRRELRPQACRRRSLLRRGLCALGRAGSRQSSSSWTSWPRVASSASRRSCPPAASTTSSAADDLTLYEGMARAAPLDRIVAVHAENDAITRALAERAIAEGRTGVRDYLASRPIIAELEAISRAILFARGDRLRAAHRPRQHGARRRPRRRGARARRRT